MSSGPGDLVIDRDPSLGLHPALLTRSQKAGGWLFQQNHFQTICLDQQRRS